VLLTLPMSVDFIILMISVKSISYGAPLCAVFFILPLFHPSCQNILISLFSDSLSVSLNMRGQVSDSYKTTDSIIVLCISLYIFLRLYLPKMTNLCYSSL
jgi:hypothetical protein